MKKSITINGHRITKANFCRFAANNYHRFIAITIATYYALRFEAPNYADSYPPISWTAINSDSVSFRVRKGNAIKITKEQLLIAKEWRDEMDNL